MLKENFGELVFDTRIRKTVRYGSAPCRAAPCSSTTRPDRPPRPTASSQRRCSMARRRASMRRARSPSSSRRPRQRSASPRRRATPARRPESRSRARRTWRPWSRLPPFPTPRPSRLRRESVTRSRSRSPSPRPSLRPRKSRLRLASAPGARRGGTIAPPAPGAGRAARARRRARAALRDPEVERRQAMRRLVEPAPRMRTTPRPDSAAHLAVIRVVGVGGAGLNAVNRMIEAGIRRSSSSRSTRTFSS